MFRDRVLSYPRFEKTWYPEALDRGKKPNLQYQLQLAKVKDSRGHLDLNQGPLDLQSNALPLSYTPLLISGS